jgi:hypothetical protein
MLLVLVVVIVLVLVLVVRRVLVMVVLLPTEGLPQMVLRIRLVCHETTR